MGACGSVEKSLRFYMIRQSVQRNQLIGSKRYIDVIEKKVGRRIES
jgi:hypothetical protein